MAESGPGQWSFLLLSVAILVMGASLFAAVFLANLGSYCIGAPGSSATVSHCYPLAAQEIWMIGILGGVTSGVLLLLSLLLHYRRWPASARAASSDAN